MQTEPQNGRQPGVISLKRQSQLFYSARKFRVYLDQQQMGRIANGACEQYDVSPGEHTVQVKIDFFSSAELKFNVLPNQTVNLRCGQNLFSLRDYIVVEYADAPMSEITSTTLSNALAAALIVISAVSLLIVLLL